MLFKLLQLVLIVFFLTVLSGTIGVSLVHQAMVELVQEHVVARLSRLPPNSVYTIFVCIVRCIVGGHREALLLWLFYHS